MTENEFIKEMGFKQINDGQFKRGDILISGCGPFIFDGTRDEFGMGCFCGTACDGELRSGIPFMWSDPRRGLIRLATEEEKESFIKLLKDKGYSYEDIVKNRWYHFVE